MAAVFCFNGNGCHLNNQVLEQMSGNSQKKGRKKKEQHKKEKDQNGDSRKKWSRHE